MDYSRNTFTRPSFHIRITEEPEYSEILSWFSSAIASTELMISWLMSENFIGDLSPLRFADVETSGLFSFPMSFFS